MTTVTERPHHAGPVPSPQPRPARSWLGRAAELSAAAPFLGIKAVLFAIFVVVPFVMTIVLTFQRGNFFRGFEWVALDNYQSIVSDALFWRSLGNTMLLAVITVPAATILSCLVGLILTARVRGIGIYRALIYMPSLLSVVATGIVWKAMIAPGVGPLDRLVRSVFEVRLGWLTESTTAFIFVALVTVWSWIGFYALIFMAGFNGIPEELIEAAQLDGARGWQILWHVKLPLIRNVAQVVIVLATISSVQIFDLVYVMTRGGPGTSTYTAMWYVYQQAFGGGGSIPYAATMSVVLLVITLALSVAFFLLTRQRKEHT